MIIRSPTPGAGCCAGVSGVAECQVLLAFASSAWPPATPATRSTHLRCTSRSDKGGPGTHRAGQILCKARQAMTVDPDGDLSTGFDPVSEAF